MVKLEEVPDESYENPQSGPVGDENDWEDDTDGTGRSRPFFIFPRYIHILHIQVWFTKGTHSLVCKPPFERLPKIGRAGDRCLLHCSKNNPLTPPATADSQLSDDDDDISDIYATEQESIFDRIYALKDIISPSTRKSLTRFWRTGTAYFSAGLLWSGKALWVVGSSALLLGVPWALAYTEEQQMIEMEREMRMQQTSAEVCHVSFS